MPIRPENRDRYPADWKEISSRIRFERADGLCEFCQIARHGQPHPVTGSTVVLTTAHLSEEVEDCSDDNLAAMCQRCHNCYDAPMRRRGIAERKALPLFDCIRPQRIQLKRTKGWRKPEGVVVVARPTKWGNPFVAGQIHRRPRNGPGGQQEIPVTSVDDAVRFYRQYLSLELRIAAKIELAGKDLACWCPLDRPCHADVLLDIANRQAKG